MSTAENYNEPWHLVPRQGGFAIVDKDDNTILEGHHEKQASVERARRIVACVNACENYQTDMSK